MSGQIWIQTVWHSYGIPERIFQGSWFWKKIADDKKASKITQQAIRWHGRHCDLRCSATLKRTLIVFDIIHVCGHVKNATEWFMDILHYLNFAFFINPTGLDLQVIIMANTIYICLKWFSVFLINIYMYMYIQYLIIHINRDLSFLVSFVWFDSLRPNQQFFSYVGIGLPGLNQY